jgi:hypothetical protein
LGGPAEHFTGADAICARQSFLEPDCLFLAEGLEVSEARILLKTSKRFGAPPRCSMRNASPIA